MPVCNIMDAMELPSIKKEMAECKRIGKKEDGPILVKWSNVHTKREVLRKIRQIKGITLKQCNLEGTRDKKIYFNEDLPMHRRELYKKVRDIRKEKKYKAAFCVNGVIYLKENDQEEPIKIRQECDVFDLA